MIKQCEFTPGELVLVRDVDGAVWCPDLFIYHGCGTTYQYRCARGSFAYCIKFDENLVNTSAAPAERNTEEKSPQNTEESSPLHPQHYSRWKIEPWDFIAANKLDFLTGNVIKYVMRHDGKNGLEDLQKARVYLDKLISEARKNANR